MVIATLVTYATKMLTVTVACSRCGCEGPSDPDELLTWRHGELALEGVVEDGLQVCPDCDSDHREMEFDEGGE